MSQTDPVDVERRGDVVHLRVTGDIDLMNRLGLLTRVVDESHGARRVVLDLSAVGFIDSAGVRFVFDAGRELARQGVDLALVRPAAAYAARILAIAAIEQAVPLYDAAPEAIADD